MEPTLYVKFSMVRRSPLIITQPLRTEQEETRDLTTAIQEQAPKGLGLKSTEQSENPIQNKHPRNSSMTESGADKNPELNEKLQDALAQAVVCLHMVFVSKNANTLEINFNASIIQYEILDTPKFTSDRKMMSVMVKDC